MVLPHMPSYHHQLVLVPVGHILGGAVRPDEVEAGGAVALMLLVLKLDRLDAAFELRARWRGMERAW